MEAIKVTGIGKGKNIISKNLTLMGIEHCIIDYYSVDNSKKNLILIIYDGLCIDTYLFDFKFLKDVSHIPIFIDGVNIHVFGCNIQNTKVKSTKNTCPRCMIKKVSERYMNLKLYDTLFTRTDYKTVSEIYKDEYRHFTSLLMKSINEKNIQGSYIKYHLLNNLYFGHNVSGLSNCEICDPYEYGQDELLKDIEGVI